MTKVHIILYAHRWIKGEFDAIANASTPNMDALMSECSWLPLAAHGKAVGLPDGLMGNSEVGHLNIGAGRVVYQDIVRIDGIIAREELAGNLAWNAALKHAASNNGRLHLIGLVSDGGVHSHIRHLNGLIKAAAEEFENPLYLHAITDGRDTAPAIAETFIKDFLNHPHVRLATIVGRYYAMDRDKRWERTKIAIDAFLHGVGEAGDDPLDCLARRLAAGETDEFIRPIIVDPEGMIREGDAIVCFNYRSDRMRQLAQVLAASKPEFPVPGNLYVTTMTLYQPDLPFPVISPPQNLTNVLAEYLSNQGMTQCHVAETEKIAHVTFFFNGGQNTKYPGEEHILIPSPAVATYDLAPSMSVEAVGDAMIGAVQGSYDFVLGNLAPPDMVGHTGNYEATLKAVEATDAVIGKIWKACRESSVALLVTADHGNAECMRNPHTGAPHTAHTCAPVPLILWSPDPHQRLISEAPEAALCNVAPTILDLYRLPCPPEMSGKSLLLQ